MNQFSVDWTYAINSTWSVNGYLSTGQQQLDQSRPGATLMAYDNRSNTFGLGFTGRVANWDVGGTISYIKDRNAYKQTLDATADAGSVHTRISSALFGRPPTQAPAARGWRHQPAKSSKQQPESAARDRSLDGSEQSLIFRS